MVDKPGADEKLLVCASRVEIDNTRNRNPTNLFSIKSIE
jgi:hypothetical protein